MPVEKTARVLLQYGLYIEIEQADNIKRNIERRRRSILQNNVIIHIINSDDWLEGKLTGSRQKWRPFLRRYNIFCSFIVYIHNSKLKLQKR